METYLIELLRPIELSKENCPPISFEQGTVLKVIMQSSSILMVTADSKFNFTLPLAEQNLVWRKI